MSCHNPGSWSLTNTEAEMCMADTSTMPSRMPAAARHFSTSSVMSMISWRLRVLNVRYVVCVFMAGRERDGQIPSRMLGRPFPSRGPTRAAC
jgi:hypothetical protein